MAEKSVQEAKGVAKKARMFRRKDYRAMKGLGLRGCFKLCSTFPVIGKGPSPACAHVNSVPIVPLCPIHMIQTMLADKNTTITIFRRAVT